MEFAAVQVRSHRAALGHRGVGGWIRVERGPVVPPEEIARNTIAWWRDDTGATEPIGSLSTDSSLSDDSHRRHIQRAARMGVVFEEYLRAWSILLEMARAADSIPLAEYTALQDACRSTCERFKQTVIRTEARSN